MISMEWVSPLALDFDLHRVGLAPQAACIRALLSLASDRIWRTSEALLCARCTCMHQPTTLICLSIDDAPFHTQMGVLAGRPTDAKRRNASQYASTLQCGGIVPHTPSRTKPLFAVFCCGPVTPPLAWRAHWHVILVIGSGKKCSGNFVL